MAHLDWHGRPGIVVWHGFRHYRGGFKVREDKLDSNLMLLSNLYAYAHKNGRPLGHHALRNFFQYGP